MPELPEVETVRRGLEQLTLHQTIMEGEVLLARTIAAPESVEGFLAGVKGTAIAGWQRRGKYLLARLVDGEEPGKAAGWLGVHLRMTGQLLWLKPTEPVTKHTRVRLFLGSDQELRFVDQRTFGQMWWVPPSRDPQDVIQGLQHLGPEPFTSDFSADYLLNQLQHRRCSVKAALLNQSIVAGVGNIYADEALFLSGIRPATLCIDLQPQQVQRLQAAVIQVLQTSIEQGGTTFSDFLNVQGVNGNYGGVASVYNRTGEPCRVCDTPIQRLRLVGRSAHFCPQCQY
jgi:formamidopyrimidine-DNA glycosylase